MALGENIPKYWADTKEFSILGTIYRTVIAPILEKSENEFKKATHISTWDVGTLKPIARRLGYWNAERMTPEQMREEILYKLRSHGVMNEAEFIRIVRESVESENLEVTINTHHNISVKLEAPASELDYTEYKRGTHPLLAYDILLMNLGFAFPAGVRLILNAKLEPTNHTIGVSAVPTVNILIKDTAVYVEPPTHNGYIYDAEEDVLVPVRYDDEEETVTVV